MSSLKLIGLLLGTCLSSGVLLAQGSFPLKFPIKTPATSNQLVMLNRAVIKAKVKNTSATAVLDAWASKDGSAIRFIYTNGKSVGDSACKAPLQVQLFWEDQNYASSDDFSIQLSNSDARCGYNGSYSTPGGSLLLAGNYRLRITQSGNVQEQLIRIEPCTSCVITTSVEYLQKSTGHYYQTADQSEQQALDAGYSYGYLGKGWQRTGENFKVWQLASVQLNNTVPVVQFLNPGPKTYFLTNDPDDISLLLSLPAGGWSYDKEVFSLMPTVNAERCPANLQPIYRLYNQGFAQNNSNHRYVTKIDLASSMVKQGWLFEGMHLCAPY